MSSDKDLRTYRRADCAVFRKTAEEFGGLSNMAPGYPVRINGVRILTVEALYQACRFPHLPEVQRKIIEQTSPMTAKMVGKPYRADSRPDWDRVRVKIMRWVLRLKLAMHWSQFGALLLSTGDRPIVEDSRKDDFWGAIPTGFDTLIGMNVLGRLLMELREEVKQGAKLQLVESPAISDFCLFEEAISTIDFRHRDAPHPLDVEERTGHFVMEKSLPLFGDTPIAVSQKSSIYEASRWIAKRSNGLTNGIHSYPEYKDSKVLWMGMVPSAWRVERTKWFFRSSKELNSGRRNTNVLSLTLRGVVNNDPSSPEGMVPKDYATYQLFRRNDLVFKLIDLENVRTSRVGLVHEDGIMSSAYVRLTPCQAVNVRFFYYQYFDLYSRAVFNAMGAGVRSTLGATDLRELRIAIPPLDEQAAIVRFLDHANKKIDRFIRVKRKLIGLLNEQKQAIVHRAVTRGLDANAPLKSSGIPSLGEIPAHWDVLRTRFLFRTVTRRDVRNDDPKLSVTQRHGLIRTDEMLENSTQARNFDRFQVCHPNDLVLNKYKAHLGVFCCAFQRGLITPNYTVFRPTRHLHTHYFDLLFHTTTYRSAFRMLVYGVTEGMSPLYTQDFYRVPVLFPPIEEQKAIVERLVDLTRIQDAAITRTEREIALMQEYITRLTADIVTGKLDVREAAARLPDVPDEDDSEAVSDEVLDETETEES